MATCETQFAGGGTPAWGGPSQSCGELPIALGLLVWCFSKGTALRQEGTARSRRASKRLRGPQLTGCWCLGPRHPAWAPPDSLEVGACHDSRAGRWGSPLTGAGRVSLRQYLSEFGYLSIQPRSPRAVLWRQARRGRAQSARLLVRAPLPGVPGALTPFKRRIWSFGDQCRCPVVRALSRLNTPARRRPCRTAKQPAFSSQRPPAGAWPADEWKAAALGPQPAGAHQQ